MIALAKRGRLGGAKPSDSGHKLAPVCDHCGSKIIGHGAEANGKFFCCANCARQAGVTAVKPA